MRKRLLEILADPVSKQVLRLEAAQSIPEGYLRSESGSYPVHSGIPRVVLTQDRDQRQTETQFWIQMGPEKQL